MEANVDVAQAKALAGTLLKVFISAALAQWFILGAGLFTTDVEGLKSIAAAGAAACGVAVWNYLNPSDKRYGVGASTPE